MALSCKPATLLPKGIQIIMSNEPRRPVTDEEVATFQRDGAVLIKNVLSDEWVDLIRNPM